jgi:hypothetical protein
MKTPPPLGVVASQPPASPLHLPRVHRPKARGVNSLCHQRTASPPAPPLPRPAEPPPRHAGTPPRRRPRRGRRSDPPLPVAGTGVATPPPPVPAAPLGERAPAHTRRARARVHGLSPACPGLPRRPPAAAPPRRGPPPVAPVRLCKHRTLCHGPPHPAAGLPWRCTAHHRAPRARCLRESRRRAGEARRPGAAPGHSRLPRAFTAQCVQGRARAVQGATTAAHRPQGRPDSETSGRSDSCAADGVAETALGPGWGPRWPPAPRPARARAGGELAWAR